MQDGEDAFMHQGGSQAPTPSNVAKKLAQQNLAAGGTENTEAFNAHIVDKALEEHGKKLAKREARAAEKAEKALNKERARADRVQDTGPEGAPAGVDPRTWRNTWGKPTGRPSANVGSVSVAVEVREPRLAPTDSRQPMLLSRDVLPPLSVSRGGPGFPIPITVLTFCSLVSRGRPR
jgi:hypothetical protein